MGLTQYKAKFSKEGITGDILTELDEDILLHELGVSSKIHRIRLMKIINGQHSVQHILSGTDPYVSFRSHWYFKHVFIFHLVNIHILFVLCVCCVYPSAVIFSLSEQSNIVYVCVCASLPAPLCAQLLGWSHQSLVMILYIVHKCH